MRLETAIYLADRMQRQDAAGKALRVSVSVLLSLTVTGCIWVIDRLFKESIESQEDSRYPRDFPGVPSGRLRFEKHHNPGFVFGKLKEHRFLIAALPAAAVSAAAARLCMLFDTPHAALERLGLSLVLGGGLSNLYDRLKLGYVVDYLNLRVGALKRVVWNLGDLAIAKGMLLVLLGSFLRERRRTRRSYELADDTE